METKALTVSEEHRFTAEMEALRREGNPPQPPRSDAADEFEGRSVHVCYRVDSTLAAMTRLTAGPKAMFEMWTAGAAEIPTGPDVVDLNRVVVAVRFRGLGLFRLVMVDSLLRSVQRGFVSVVGATKPGREIVPAMLEMGFQAAGPEVMVTDPVNGRFPIQTYVVWEVSQHEGRWREMFSEQRKRLGEVGYRVDWNWPVPSDELLKAQS
jgi:hypothetical protein